METFSRQQSARISVHSAGFLGIHRMSPVQKPGFLGTAEPQPVHHPAFLVMMTKVTG